MNTHSSILTPAIPAQVMPHLIGSNAEKRDESRTAWSVFALSVFFLGCAHLAVKEFFPNPAFWLAGAGLILAAGLFCIIVLRDVCGFLLTLFVCAHFGFADNQGGLWAYVAASVLIIGLMIGRARIVRFGAVPMYIHALIFVFLLHQMLGIVLNAYSFVSNLQAIVITAAQILVFYAAASMDFSKANLRRFLMVWMGVAFWIFIVALNQKYHGIITQSPLLPQRFKIPGLMASIPAGSFGNSELFAEYFCFLFIIALILLSHRRELSELKIRLLFPILTLLASLACLIMGSSRAAVLLAGASAAYLSVINCIVAPSRRNFFRAGVLLLVLGVALAALVSFGKFVALDEMLSDFRELNVSKIDAEGVASGKAINRSLFKGAFRQLDRGSWWIGHGYNIPENNTASLGLRKGESDYHSLYLCIPFFYGWLGSAALVLIVVMTGLRSYRCYFRTRKLGDTLVPLALAFAVIWGIFLADQYKISITRNPNYFLMIWLLLGFTHAIANTLYRRLREK